MSSHQGGWWFFFLTNSSRRIATHVTNTDRRKKVLKYRSSPVIQERGLQHSSLSSAAATGGVIAPLTSGSLERSPLQILSRYRALVLDSAYRPIDVVNWQRAVCLDLLDKADVLEYYDATISSVSEEFFLPAVMRTRWYAGRLGRLNRVPLNRRNVMLRDGLTCQYCGKAGGDLTLDHVIPQSKGGPNTWDNLVAACAPCNTKKGDSTLRQLRWKLAKKPKEPSPFELNIVLAGLGVGDVKKIPAEWSSYLFSSNSDDE